MHPKIHISKEAKDKKERLFVGGKLKIVVDKIHEYLLFYSGNRVAVVCTNNDKVEMISVCLDRDISTHITFDSLLLKPDTIKISGDYRSKTVKIAYEDADGKMQTLSLS
ncbi:hypothetical protein KJ885_04020 [Patescibacteria group bacterium]|nr:hypothetical protein [Patescibacteria group bacterium]